MSYSVSIRRAAERDVSEAQRWYEGQRAGLGSEFHAEFSGAIERLAADPLIYPVVYRGVRRAVLRRFPYLVWFQIEGSVVKILACAHGKLDPAKLDSRLR